MCIHSCVVPTTSPSLCSSCFVTVTYNLCIESDLGSLAIASLGSCYHVCLSAIVCVLRQGSTKHSLRVRRDLC